MKTLIAITMLCWTMTVSAQPFLFPTNPPPVVTLAWGTVAGITNYFLYYGVGSGQYTNKTAVGNTNQFTLTLPGRGPTYYFAATCQAGTLESVFSNEVNYKPAIPPPPPPSMAQPLVLTAQIKRTATDALWVKAGMDWTIDPAYTNSVFRLIMARQ